MLWKMSFVNYQTKSFKKTKKNKTKTKTKQNKKNKNKNKTEKEEFYSCHLHARNTGTMQILSSHKHMISNFPQGFTSDF